MSTKKTIQINPELFKLPGNKTKKNKEKKFLIVVLTWNYFNKIKKNNTKLKGKFINIKDLEKAKLIGLLFEDVIKNESFQVYLDKAHFEVSDERIYNKEGLKFLNKIKNAIMLKCF